MKKSPNLLKTKTITWIVSTMALAFIVTASIFLFQYHYILKKSYTKTVFLAAEKKAFELNTFFNSAQNITKEFQYYILQTFDEERFQKDPVYEHKFLSDLSKLMTSRAALQKGVSCTFFRLEMERFGPDKGIFLTGGYNKGFVSVRPTDLSKYSPSDTEHVGWYYLPIWKKEPVWTSPYENMNLRQKMLSYCIPLYRNNKLLGVVGVDLSLAVIQDIVNSLHIDESTGLLIGIENNIINQQSMDELSKAVDRSANLSVMLEQFQNCNPQELKKVFWDGQYHYAMLTHLDNGMSYITAVTQKELLRNEYGNVITLCCAFLIVCLLTAILIFLIVRNIVNPIKIVTKTTNRLARGELYIDIPYKFNNDIGSLANNIRMMTTQLKEYIDYISEQTKKEREAKEAALTESQINAAASQAKSAFLANMSHEIRTPINAVLGMNEMILREACDKTILGYASNIKLAGNNLLSIVNDVLDFSKIEAGKMELLPENYEVSSLIIDLINMTRERAQKKGLKYELNINSNLPKTLFGDSVRIKQCILNLLTNAIKYTKKGTVTFSIDYKKTEEEKILFIVHVIDTGSGIKKEDMKKLFSPFERIEEEKNRTIEGSGLGLSIVRRLLNMMNSKLDVQSTYGKGSDFSFEIEQPVFDWTPVGDLNEAYAETVELMETYQEKLYAPRARLLFIDDTAMNLDVIKGLLKNTGMQIDTVLSGKEALEAVKNQKYDIIFIDHRMPEMDGIQTLHAMKQMPDNLSEGKPCIALTANAIQGVKKMYLEEGFDDYLSKPVNPSKLEEMICHYLPKEYLEVPVNPVIEDTKESSDFIQKLKTIKQIDEKAALKNCGTEELLLSAIRQFHSSIDSKAVELQQFFEAENWADYGIKVHALKSTSRLIGANELSKLAEYLENCINNHTETKVKTKHKNLMDLYLAFKTILKPFEKSEASETEKKEISPQELSSKIEQLKKCADTFDIDGLDSLVAELSCVALPLDFSPIFDKIRISVENVDFKNIRIILTQWSNKS